MIKEHKVEMYKALRSVQDKITKGQFVLIDDNNRPLIKEIIFITGRVLNAVILAELDPDLHDIKRKLDASIKPEDRT